MSASTETSFRHVSPRSIGVFAGLLGSFASRLQLAGRRQRVGAITVWDGQAGLRLPAGRGCFRLGLYVTFRRAPDEDDPQGPPAAAAARPPAVEAN